MYAGFMGFFTACSHPAVQPGVLWFSPHDPDAQLYHWRVAGHLLVQAVRGLHSRASILGKVGPPCHPSLQTYLFCCVLAVYLNKSTPGHCRVSHAQQISHAELLPEISFPPRTPWQRADKKAESHLLGCKHSALSKNRMANDRSSPGHT